MPDQHNIHPAYGVPKEDISCPHCGEVYGSHNRKVCKTCEECSKCCTCPKEGKRKQELLRASTFIEQLLNDL